MAFSPKKKKKMKMDNKKSVTIGYNIKIFLKKKNKIQSFKNCLVP